MNAALQQRQARDLMRLREVRLKVAAAALTDARVLTMRAETARNGAQADVALASAREADEHAGLIAEPSKAELGLARLDEARFRQAIADQTLLQARTAEREAIDAEAKLRRAVIVARVRHDALVEHAANAERRREARREERFAIEAEDIRRFR